MRIAGLAYLLSGATYIAFLAYAALSSAGRLDVGIIVPIAFIAGLTFFGVQLLREEPIRKRAALRWIILAASLIIAASFGSIAWIVASTTLPSLWRSYRMHIDDPEALHVLALALPYVMISLAQFIAAITLLWHRPSAS